MKGWAPAEHNGSGLVQNAPRYATFMADSKFVDVVAGCVFDRVLTNRRFVQIQMPNPKYL